MITEAFTCLAKEMNDYFIRSFALAEDCVIVSAISNSDGTIATNTANKIVITLVNIQEDVAIKNNIGIRNRTLPDLPVAESLNLYFIIAANFPNYKESLQFIFNAINFLKQKSIFTPSETNGLTENIEKFIIEMVNMPTENVLHLWAGLGAGYMPSAIYKMRLFYKTITPR